MWPFGGGRAPDGDWVNLHKRVQVLEHGLKALTSYLEGEIDRLDTALQNVRGIANSSLRTTYGGRPPVGRKAELQAIGERFASAIGTAAGRQELIAELQGMDANGENGSHPAGMSR